MQKYVPNPVDTSHIQLPESINSLAELLAANTHEVWAKGRLAEGWRYGIRRDDVRRETPCLIPYCALSEEERAYDRNTCMETLKMLYAMGYEIVRRAETEESV